MTVFAGNADATRLPPATPMQKASNGVWSATVGPFAPDVYEYFFSIDGVRAIDTGAALHAWHFTGKGWLLAESGELLLQTNAFDIVVVMSLAVSGDVGMIDAKAADFNFQQTPGAHPDCIFAITLMRAVDAGNLVDQVRTMTPEQRRHVFGVIDQAQGPRPALAA